ncbi:MULTISPECIES: 4'-phosphopantetheinyl transferase superfamily protein [unclassified Pseudoalteromonas]|uniref:4'-phosphopantetheinyl transferase family protein n=1 Tax=unclassified Pseudoalteromonas TaxID=194690 RepID=UPI0025B5633D|nr:MULTISPECIES: 4'-phosphopantetheinyl transferase superfamily protein [unclassified Pseudoalteromonas]MDN3381022.1 4'-phosphopantetheinyl transferase superfamily protein [Pseudoalteromonas sp. APC 3893]MDN3389424.1 4'-phosphopantetheinyl transferase superfamily protein [Pseudoalteromonas sp. APC 4017]
MKFITNLNRLHLINYPDIVCFQCRYDIKEYSDELFSFYEISDEFERISNAVVKRKAEFLAGRYCARLAQEAIGLQVAKLPVGQHRNPIWPENTNGSITHSGHLAFAAVARRSLVPYFGIDYEEVMEPDLADKLMHTIINNQEKHYFEKFQFSFSFMLTLAFSAKESLFKTLYPLVNQYFDFSAAELIDFQYSNNQFTLRLTEQLTPLLNKGMEFTGHLTTYENSLLTFISYQPK